MTWIDANTPPPFTQNAYGLGDDLDVSDWFLVRTKRNEHYIAKYTSRESWVPNETGCGCCSDYNLDVAYYMEIPDGNKKEE